MENENVIKSIIYGNKYQNRYGKFLPICSSIIDRASISGILDYLKESPHFHKFNRVAYAYRVDQMPVVFITEKKNTEAQYYEGHHSDQTIEGSGEKLLHLLQKFNIRNVLIAVLIQQFNPLLPFQTTNYRAIVENSRVLLDQLYKRVVQFQEHTHQSPNDLLLSSQKIIKTNKVQIGNELQLPNPKPQHPKERPNHINSGTGSKTKITMVSKKSVTKNLQNEGIQQQLAFLWDRCKNMKEQYSKIGDSLSDKEIQQLKYFVMYDKNPTINIVIQMLLLFLGVSRDQLVEDFDFSYLKTVQLQVLSKERLRKLDQILKTNKKITVDSILKINRGLGMIFSIIQLRIRFTKCVERITQLVEKAQKNHSNISEQRVPLVQGISRFSGNNSHEISKNVKIDPNI